MNLKKFILLFSFLTSLAQAQTVVVSKQDQRIKGENIKGYSTTLEAGKSEVTAALNRYLKTFGKVKNQEEMLTVAEPLVNGQLQKVPLVGVVKGNEQKATAWIGYATTVNDSSSVDVRAAEGMMKTFGLNFYRDKIQGQIDEAQRAVEAVEKQQQRTLSENKSLTQRVANNTNEYNQLVKAIQTNRSDSVTLQVRLTQNKQMQDSLTVVLEKVKKAVEIQKERQRKVN
jgi:hypothetical protein